MSYIMALVQRLESCSETSENDQDRDCVAAAKEIMRLRDLHLDRTKSTHKALTERDKKIEALATEGKLKDAVIEAARPCARGCRRCDSFDRQYTLQDALKALDSAQVGLGND